MADPLRIAPFLGMSPRTAERLLPDGAAVDATNLVLTSGEIRPIKKPALEHTPSGSGPWSSVYRAEYNSTEVWLAWNVDVDVARVPLSYDVEARYCWTGDNEPRYAPFSGLPGTFYSLGIPAPKAKPTVGHSGGSGSAVSRVYGYTFFSALGEESAMSPASDLTAGKVDGTWAIAAMDAFPVSSGTVTGSWDGVHTTFTMAAAANHWLRAKEEITIASIDMLVVEVPSASTFKVTGDHSAETAWARVAPWNTSGMKRRLYRSAGTNATYQLVDDNVGTTYNDTKTDSQILGDELISATWELPPVNLRGAFVLPNGCVCGFAGNQLCYSEPYQAHAWPVANQYGTDFEIVGAAAYGSTVVAATAGCPYVFTGTDPAAVSPEKVDSVWPCLSKRGVVALPDGVAYPTAYGLAYIGATGPAIMTLPMFSKVEWAPLDPASMVGAVSEGRIFMRWAVADGSSGIMVFGGQDQVGLTQLSAVPDEMWVDPRTGRLYFVDSTGIYLYDTDSGDRLPYSWRSKEYYLPAPANFGAARVDLVSEQDQADFDAAAAAYTAALAANTALMTSYKGGGALGRSALNAQLLNGSALANLSPPSSAAVTFTLYYGGQAFYSKTLTSSKSFKLRAGKKSDAVSIGLTGTVRVKSVVIGETLASLKQV